MPLRSIGLFSESRNRPVSGSKVSDLTRQQLYATLQISESAVRRFELQGQPCTPVGIMATRGQWHRHLTARCLPSSDPIWITMSAIQLQNVEAPIFRQVVPSDPNVVLPILCTVEPSELKRVLPICCEDDPSELKVLFPIRCDVLPSEP